MKYKSRTISIIKILLGIVLFSISCGNNNAARLKPVDITPGESISPVGQVSQSLNGEWRFMVEEKKNGIGEGWFNSRFDDSSWLKVEVPHTWNTMDAYYTYEGVAWYRCEFVPDAEIDNAALRLNFSAVFYKAKVWLNGEYLGEHEGGYTPFAFDISGLVKTGKGNVIAVRVDNTRLSDQIPDDVFDWWHYGGIVRNVSLEITSRAYIDRQFIVAVPNITAWDQANVAAITTTVVVSNTSSETLVGTLSAQIFDDEGISILDEPVTKEITVLPGQTQNIELITTVENPKLWHFDHPNLYRWQTSLLLEDGRTLHTKEDTFGIRMIELKEAKLFLNGEPVRMVGMTRHADSPEFGLAEPYSVMAADYDDMKRLNMVLSRPVHYPQDESVLDYCDRNGILLIPEIPAWQIEARHLVNPMLIKTAKQQLTEMILADFNHPSIWAWSVGNEIDSHLPAGHDYVKEMVALARELDPNRPVGFASYHLYENQEMDATAYTDFVLMNEYCGSWAGPKSVLSEALDRIHELWPEKVVIISEFGLEAGWTSAWWISDSFRMDTPDYYFIPPGTSPYSEEVYAIRSQLIKDQMDIFRSKTFVAGAIFWTYQDYRSAMEFKMGILDINRNPSPVWQVIREQYSPIRKVSVSLSEEKPEAHFEILTRGPLDEDMPVYTLRGYSLSWEVISKDRSRIFSHGQIPLPVLSPAETWAGMIDFDLPEEDYLIVFGIIRPTGFAVWEKTYRPNGEVLE